MVHDNGYIDRILLKHFAIKIWILGVPWKPYLIPRYHQGTKRAWNIKTVLFYTSIGTIFCDKCLSNNFSRKNHELQWKKLIARGLVGLGMACEPSFGWKDLICISVDFAEALRGNNFFQVGGNSGDNQMRNPGVNKLAFPPGFAGKKITENKLLKKFFKWLPLIQPAKEGESFPDRPWQASILIIRIWQRRVLLSDHILSEKDICLDHSLTQLLTFSFLKGKNCLILGRGKIQGMLQDYLPLLTNRLWWGQAVRPYCSLGPGRGHSGSQNTNGWGWDTTASLLTKKWR